jgi:hypothetical protein
MEKQDVFCNEIFHDEAEMDASDMCMVMSFFTHRPSLADENKAKMIKALRDKDYKKFYELLNETSKAILQTL